MDIPDGAEMWQMNPDGTQTLVAVFRASDDVGKWARVAEQAGSLL